MPDPRRWSAVLLALVVVGGSAEAGQSAHTRAARPLTILDVPFISQSEALCGGAAAAMIMRYWGTRGVDAESFAHLVDRSAAGIRTTVLLDDLRRRGWNATMLDATDETLSGQLARGRPILVLIEDRPGTFHYVVIVGATPNAVVYHDPARSAFRTMSRDEFDRRTASAGHWSALVLPQPVSATGSIETPAPIRPESPCDALIDSGTRSAQSNDLESAERQLTTALSCGGSAALRELAGVRLLQRRWPEVRDLAGAAVSEDPTDSHAWRLLATSRFVQDDRGGALDAWNRVDEPRVDLIRIDGLERTRQRVVERLLAVERDEVLTSSGLLEARRQLRELPSAVSSQLTFVPVPSGLAEIQASVSERPLLPSDRWSLAALGVTAAVRREVEVSMGAFTGGGERVTVGWRFWPGRPLVRGAFAAPAPWGGVWGIDAFAERQPFSNDAIPASERRGAHAEWSDWVTSWARATLRGGVEQWESVETFGMAAGGLRLATAADRFAARIDAVRWLSGSPFGTVELGGTFRSTQERRGHVFVVRSGVSAASGTAPVDLWFAGDTGRARGIPLRAHPLIDGGEIRVERTGRRIGYASAEVQRWWRPRLVALGGAVFLDTARVSRRYVPDSLTDVDLGMGARLAVPGIAGVLRVDVAKGLRDGATAVSFVFEP